MKGILLCTFVFLFSINSFSESSLEKESAQYHIISNANEIKESDLNFNFLMAFKEENDLKYKGYGAEASEELGLPNSQFSLNSTAEYGYVGRKKLAVYQLLISDKDYKDDGNAIIATIMGISGKNIIGIKCIRYDKSIDYKNGKCASLIKKTFGEYLSFI